MIPFSFLGNFLRGSNLINGFRQNFAELQRPTVFVKDKPLQVQDKMAEEKDKPVKYQQDMSRTAAGVGEETLRNLGKIHNK